MKDEYKNLIEEAKQKAIEEKKQADEQTRINQQKKAEAKANTQQIFTTIENKISRLKQESLKEISKDLKIVRPDNKIAAHLNRMFIGIEAFKGQNIASLIFEGINDFNDVGVKMTTPKTGNPNGEPLGTYPNGKITEDDIEKHVAKFVAELYATGLISV
jgi:CRISPR/Cas system CSM-associated protein Csm2 small subunit